MSRWINKCIRNTWNITVTWISTSYQRWIQFWLEYKKGYIRSFYGTFLLEFLIDRKLYKYEVTGDILICMHCVIYISLWWKHLEYYLFLRELQYMNIICHHPAVRRTPELGTPIRLYLSGHCAASPHLPSPSPVSDNPHYTQNFCGITFLIFYGCILVSRNTYFSVLGLFPFT